MNKELLTVLLVASISSAMKAQSLPPGRTEEAYVMTDKGIVGTIELDTAQRRQVESIERRYGHELDLLLENDTISDAAAKATADRITLVRHQEMKAVLSPEQYERWARMIADTDIQ